MDIICIYTYIIKTKNKIFKTKLNYKWIEQYIYVNVYIIKTNDNQDEH